MENFSLNSFRQLTSVAESIAESGNKNKKISLCAKYLESIQNDNDLNLAVRFLFEGPFPPSSEKKIRIGSRTIYTCVSGFCEIDYERVFKPSKAAMGDAEETIEKLMANIEAACQKRTAQNLSLMQVEKVFEEMNSVSSRAGKQQILWETWTKMTPLEIKYFIRLLRHRPLPVGMEKHDVIKAIAKAFKQNPDKIKNALLISGSFAKTVILSKTDDLGDADFKLFYSRPLMHAVSTNSQAINDTGTYIIEEKINGIRCQAHIGREQVRLFTDGTDVTQNIPEVKEYFESINASDLVLDGVLCVFKNEEILPAQLLRKRLKTDYPSDQILKEIPVLFIAFDILYYNSQPYFRHPLSERRSALEKLVPACGLPVTNQFKTANPDELNFLLERSVRRGNNGLMLKKKDSVYKCDQRDESWLKITGNTNTLKGVVMYAHIDSNNRHNGYTAFTLGVNVTNDERYKEEFIPIGKIPNSCSTQVLEELDKQIRKLTVEKYGPTLGLIPEIVVEAEFDDIQANKRTKANYKLYRPRFKTMQRDLSPADVDTLKGVERMYEEKVNRDRLKQDKNPSFLFKKDEGI